MREVMIHLIYLSNMHKYKSWIFYDAFTVLLEYIHEKAEEMYNVSCFDTKDKYSIKEDLLENFIERNKGRKGKRYRSTTTMLILYINIKKNDSLYSFQARLWSYISAAELRWTDWDSRHYKNKTKPKIPLEYLYIKYKWKIDRTQKD